MTVTSLIATAASRHELPSELIAAFVAVESGGNAYAWNPEPKYRYLWDVKRNRPFRVLTHAEIEDEVPPSDFPCIVGDRDQEWWGQAASWGLMQVMGAVARECGYRQPYLPQLCDPADGIEFGCRHLAALKARFFAAQGWDGVIAAYNAGSPRRDAQGAFINQVYVDRIREALNGDLSGSGT